MFPFFVKVEQKLIFYRLMTFLSRCYYQSSNFLIYILCQSSSHFPGFKDLESVFPTWLNFLIETIFLNVYFFLPKTFHFVSCFVVPCLVEFFVHQNYVRKTNSNICSNFCRKSSNGLRSQWTEMWSKAPAMRSPLPANFHTKERRQNGTSGML